MWWMELMDEGPSPKRGDLIQTNVGARKERTWFVLYASRKLRAKTPRWSIWKVRWWELEPQFRQRLYQSARRNGGQTVFHCHPLKPQGRKRTFEDYMARQA
jgi:hypothetical protein